MLASARQAAFLASACLAACSVPHSRTPSGQPPRAEFLLDTADSTFWVATTTGGMHVRGAPLLLARYDGRFYEIYTTDDDRSYDDALLLGQRLYRRDLITGDSTLVFADTTVPRIAEEYAHAHPNERPLAPDEEGDPDPSTSATAEVDVIDIHGPYVSYEYHVDVSLPGRELWHSTRNGVVDLHSGAERRVTDLFGRAAGARAARAAHRAYDRVRDSLRGRWSQLDPDERDAARALEGRSFDDRSFTLAGIAGQPRVFFSLPGAGAGPAGNVVELEPVSVDSTPWWTEVAAGLPRTDAADNDVWTGPGYRVLARYDTSGEVAHVSLADSTGREWPVADVLTPVRRIDWLDRPALGSVERQALLRAFDEAAAYDQDTRIAAHSPPFTSNLQLVARHAPRQVRSRKSARNLGTHDARACQQPRPCVRGRHPLDDGQDRGDRGLPALPVHGRHRLD